MSKRTVSACDRAPNPSSMAWSEGSVWLASAHAGAAGLALAKKCPKNKAVVINMSGRGDKDLFIAARELAGESWTGFLKAEVKRCESR